MRNAMKALAASIRLLTAALLAAFPALLFAAPMAAITARPEASHPRADSGASAPIDSAALLMARGHLAAARGDDGRLEPGPLYRIGRVEVVGKPFTAEQLGIAAYAGRAATAEQVAELGSRARDWLADHGRPFASLRVEFSAHADAPVVDLRVLLEAGEGFRHGGFKAFGSRTRPEVLDRLSLLRPGDDFSVTRLRLSLDRLARLGYFESIVPGELYRDPVRNLIYPSLALADLKGNRLAGILGYDSENKDGDGLTGYLDIHLINLRGTARDLDFAFDSRPGGSGNGAARKDARLAYVEPWLFSTRTGARLEVSALVEDSVYQELGGELSLFQDLDFRSRLSISAGRQYTRDFLADTRSDAQTAGIGFLYDARDRAPSTLRGVRWSARINGVRRAAGDSSRFLARTRDEFAWWANTGRWVFHALLAGGGDWPLESRPDRGDLFELGGANSIRGYREREFLTDAYAYANIEIQFLLAPQTRATVFTVPGLVNRIGRADIWWRRVLGYGLGLESGARNWTFGISYALNPDRAVGDGFLHLRVENNF